VEIRISRLEDKKDTYEKAEESLDKRHMSCQKNTQKL
jgi:hypothetical protein